MTITEKNLAEKLKSLFLRTPIDDKPWEQIARRAAKELGVELAPEPKPLPTEPGDAIIATGVRGVKGRWTLILGTGGDWSSAEPISGVHWHRPDHITKWTEARIVPAGEQIDVADVREGDQVRLVLDSGHEVTITVTCVDRSWFESRYDVYSRHTIRAVYLLHREDA